ncbi:Acetyltransferase [Cavenderia fasciculata]|uniref:Acetyltransferase n=1 Tax=Cavenderia fasciculata TaxID=261658 RepID=F4PKX8_CACFS|nr:Acetyltransferase [Cavenderia fasciculata]EGG23200.1 Acetyltransferase [Cavenderia fasciculata]|eukprot:XP_004361051.1 Acetyltransferase [Cavenderia fasciculata]
MEPKHMTEKEKMIAGMLYLANEDTLVKDRIDVKEKCYDFNMIRPSQRKEREDKIKTIFGKSGNNPFVESPFNCDYGYNITVGDNFYSNHGLVILDVAPVTIGNTVMMGPNCSILTAGHPIDVQHRNSGEEFGTKIDIGSNVWLGGSVTILPGVTIGDGTVIGAGSVVTKSIPANCIAVGNPCKVLREINDADRAKYRK